MGTYNNINDAQKELNDKLSKLGVATAIQVFNNIIIETPVDTGRARGNWQASLGNPISGVVSEEASKGIKFDVSKDIQNWTIKDIAYLTNNLPYIEPLELGWSGQRPNGWVRANVDKGQSALDQAIQKLGGN